MEEEASDRRAVRFDDLFEWSVKMILSAFRVMRLAAPALVMTGAVCAAPLHARGEPATPSRGTIAQIESGFALRDIIKSVGIVDSAWMNRHSRVHVRKVRCVASDAGAALCTYEADRGLPGEPDMEGWRERTTTFVRSTAFDPLTSAQGWTIVRPDD